MDAVGSLAHAMDGENLAIGRSCAVRTRPAVRWAEERCPRLTLLVLGLCLGWLSTPDADAGPLVFECSIGEQERSEVLIVDLTRKSIRIGDKIIQVEVTAQSITWKESGTVRVIDRSTGAVLHRLPDESYFHIGQCRSSDGKF
jgi:hypothetical protein